MQLRYHSKPCILEHNTSKAYSTYIVDISQVYIYESIAADFMAMVCTLPIYTSVETTHIHIKCLYKTSDLRHPSMQNDLATYLILETP